MLRTESGFTLLHMAVALAVLAVMIAVAIPGGDKARVDAKQRAFISQVEIFEGKQRSLMVAQGRRYCPSDITLSESDPNFGRELPHGPNCMAGISASDCCTGAGPGGYYGPSNGVIAGGVPVVDMGLEKSAAFGPTKNRIMMVVTQSATSNPICCAAGMVEPRIVVKDSAAGRWLGVDTGAYVDFGEDGEGATPAQGGTIRRVAGNLDADTLENAGLTPGMMPVFDNVLVSRPHGPGFDDNVVRANGCCLGPGCMLCSSFGSSSGSSNSSSSGSASAASGGASAASASSSGGTSAASSAGGSSGSSSGGSSSSSGGCTSQGGDGAPCDGVGNCCTASYVCDTLQNVCRNFTLVCIDTPVTCSPVGCAAALTGGICIGDVCTGTDGGNSAEIDCCNGETAGTPLGQCGGSSSGGSSGF